MLQTTKKDSTVFTYQYNVTNNASGITFPAMVSAKIKQDADKKIKAAFPQSHLYSIVFDRIVC